VRGYRDESPVIIFGSLGALAVMMLVFKDSSSALGAVCSSRQTGRQGRLDRKCRNSVPMVWCWKWH
jgi:hypothetical protein